MSESRRIIEPASHEFAANLNYTEHGLKPWLAADSVVKQHDGGTVLEAVELPSLENPADVSIRYQDGNLLPPADGETPAGTEISHDTIREFRIHVAENDGHGGLRSIDFHIRPRWYKQQARTNAGETITLPDGGLSSPHTDGVSVRANGSNIEFLNYDQLLAEAATELGISSRYFEQLHETSNIQDAARYVRVHEAASGPIHARDGPLVGLAHVLENDRDGYRKLVQNDSDERDVQKPGFYHTTTLGVNRVQEIWPDHTLPVEIKHYYKKDYYERSDGLAHPKLEAAYQTARTDETLRYNEETIRRIENELDEIVYAVLADAGLDLRAGGETYVADEIFLAENAITDATIVDLPLSEIRHEQESVVIKHLSDGLSPVEFESLETLVTDGGTVSPGDIATRNERNLDSVYRALNRLDDLVEAEYGRVSLKSEYVADLVHTSVQQARESVSRAVDTTAEALEAADRGLDEHTSAFVAWCEAHDLNFNEKDDEVKITLGEIDAETVKDARRKARQRLREGYKMWSKMNRDEVKFRIGSWKAHVDVLTEHSRLRSTSLEETETKFIGGQNWEAVG